jgi:hypothetical protein
MNVMFSNKIKDKITSQTISTVPENMFRVSRTVACSKAALLRQIRAEIEEDREELLANGRRKKKGKFYWVKEWGYGPAAYLFDFLDPIYVESVTKEMNMMFQSLKAFPMLDKDYKDPFDFKKLISLDSTLLNRKLLKQLKLFTKNYDPEVYNLSLNTVQVRKAMINWKWTGEKSNPNFAKKFVSRFDMNFDGRLNPRELVLGSIMNNRGIMGTQLCQQCFNNSTKSIDQVFLYLDCNDDGWLSAEEFWNNMNNLNRNTDKNKTSTADEQIKVDKLLQAKREIEAAKAKPERTEAASKATTKEEGGVKITEYPYAGKNEFKNGGKVSASSRADGIAQRGRTRGKMY